MGGCWGEEGGWLGVEGFDGWGCACSPVDAGFELSGCTDEVEGVLGSSFSPWAGLPEGFLGEEEVLGVEGVGGGVSSNTSGGLEFASGSCGPGGTEPLTSVYEEEATVVEAPGSWEVEEGARCCSGKLVPGVSFCCSSVSRVSSVASMA